METFWSFYPHYKHLENYGRRKEEKHMGDSGFRCPVYLTTHFFGLGGTQIACAIEAIVCTSTARWPKGNASRTTFREPTWFMSQLGNGVSVLHSVLLVQPAFIFYMVCF